jgi:hypothetical protein
MISDQAYDGQRLFDLFASQWEGLWRDERNQEAESRTNYVCASTTVVKLFSGLGANQVWLPVLWNRTEDVDGGIKEGSFSA